MFEYLEPDAAGASNLPSAPGDGSLPVPPNTGLPGKGIRPLSPDRLRHLLYGSRAAIDRTIKILHSYGYADPNDWSDPMPTDKPGQWMAILTKTLLLE